ncbi:hypothetical protein LU631_03380 [Erwinia tracheiphila]|uniref:hypothetical protein n=1 Tax=Erwinia tracheiphila TaxID=65700 RepID=UPI001E2F2836|nr:hypothetical protein [Erwinia tracheiphila]UIA88470.1 hypothetical protein LU631_03380 [Erwinia tracheiphila]UIA96848.1 hypothetical protein LU633_02055 [Erwinia tracheiphila]
MNIIDKSTPPGPPITNPHQQLVQVIEEQRFVPQRLLYFSRARSESEPRITIRDFGI